MEIINLKQLLAGPVVNALCHTLFHSLWQGLLFAAIGGIVVVFTRQSRPLIRYRILTVLFLLMVIVSVITFCYQLQSFKELSTVRQSGHFQKTIYPVYHLSPGIAYPVASRQFSAWLSVFLSKYAGVITAAWLVILMAKTFKMVFTLAYTRYRVKRNSYLVPAYWSNRLQWFCRQLQINRHVTIMESSFIKIPVVFGHIKPVIFIPLGLLAQLPPGQVEAILIHELAHIRRGDYLINLLQNLAETVFFFNPALLWISSLIREERENCCDDTAIAQTNNKKQYIEALIGFREFSLYGDPKYAMAFAGKKGSLLSRVSRMVQNSNHSLNAREKSSLLCSCIIALLLAIFASPASGTSAKHFTKVVKHYAVAAKNSIMGTPVKALGPTENKTVATHHHNVHNETDSLQKTEPAFSPPASNTDESIPNEIVFKEQPDTTPVTPYFKKHKMLSPNIVPPDVIKHKKAAQLADEEFKFERRKKSPPRGFQVGEIVAHISDYLFDHKIISDRYNLSFELTNAALLVNGVKQPDDLAEMMAGRYLNEFSYPVDNRNRDERDFGIFYNAQTGGMGIGIIRHKKKPAQQ